MNGSSYGRVGRLMSRKYEMIVSIVGVVAIKEDEVTYHGLKSRSSVADR